MTTLTPLHIVRARGQFGPVKVPGTFRVFLDDARNPPLNERDWIVVRTVADGLDLLVKHGEKVTELSLDNDLGPDPQGIEMLRYVLHNRSIVPNLQKVIVHTGNLPKWRMMIRELRGSGLLVQRRVPHDRIYPRAVDDSRTVKAYVA
jgi:hypothetical protein